MQKIPTPAAAIDVLIAELGGALDPGKHSKGPCELLLGNLQTAKCSLLGGMFVEYTFSLEQAVRSSANIPDRAVREQTRNTLRGLIAQQAVLEARRGKHLAVGTTKAGTK